MNKIKKFLFGILAVVIISVIGIGIWQMDNITAVINAFKYSGEELTQKINENKNALEREIVEKYNIAENFTEEEEQKIISGEMSVEEAVAKKQAEMDEKLSEKTSATNSESKKKTDAIVSKRIIEFYSLKAYYLGQLGQMEAKVKADYAQLPQDKKNLIGKKELVNKYMSVATSLLNQCDAQINELTASLEKEIKAVGGDTSIIKTIKDAYENEKNLKKSYYISKLK